jgi:hypothetical protein
MSETQPSSLVNPNDEFYDGPDDGYHLRRLLQVAPLTLAIASINVDVRGYAKIVFIPGSSATLKYSVVDSLDASAHLMPAAPDASAGDDAAVEIAVAGNFYRLEVATAISSLHFIP